MQLIIIVLAILFITAAPSLLSQTTTRAYEFTYDASGNRRIREHHPIYLRKGVDQEAEKEVTQKLPDHQIVIYPNPAKSYFDVKVSNLTKDSKTSINLIDLTGRSIFTQEGLGEVTTVDVSKHTNGVYFMQIIIDGHVTDWKIIKEE